MKKIILLTILSGMALAAAGQLTETRTVSGFTGIDASGVFDITVTKGAKESLVITADEKVMPLVRSKVQNGVLKLFLDKPARNVRTLKAAITVKNLETVELSGACKLNSEDVFTPDKCDIDLSGSTSLRLTVETRELSLDASGACKVVLNATVKEEIEFDLSGAVNVQSNLTAGRVEVDMSGSGRIELSGAADAASFDLSGATKVMAMDLALKKAKVESSGVSNVEIHVTEALSVDLSGASAVRYKGSPSAFEVKTSGASSVKKIE
jgi:hypothetical protein